MTQRMIEIVSAKFIPDEQLITGITFAELFGNNKPLALEIGCGTGHFIADRARQQPDINFLAIDIYNKGCLKTCKKLDLLKIDNVRVLRAEARYLLTSHMQPESLKAIYINCPDPWPKKRHRTRRLVNRDFLQLALHYLQPGGDLYFSSDFRDYAAEVTCLLPKLTGYQNCLDRRYARTLPGYPTSKYMQRFLSLGQPIYYLHYRRHPEVLREELPLPHIQLGFRTRWSRAENE